jgi:outer membrane protein TolC
MQAQELFMKRRDSFAFVAVLAAFWVGGVGLAQGPSPESTGPSDELEDSAPAQRDTEVTVPPSALEIGGVPGGSVEGEPEDAASRGLRALYVPGGLTAEEAVHQSIETSPSLERTQALALEAKGGALQAMSGLVPRMDLSGNYTRLSSVERPPQFPLFVDQYTSDATLGYSFTGALAESLPSYRAAKKSKAAAKHQIQAERNNVAFEARQAYYEFARAEAALGVAQVTLEQGISQRKETEALVKAGAAPRVDALRTEAQVEAAKVAVARAELGVQVARRALQTLMHVEEPPTLGEDLSQPVGGVPREGEAALRERALSERPDLQALRTYVAVKEHQVRASRGGTLPDVGVAGRAEYSKPNFRVFPQVNQFQSTWDVTAFVAWSPNDTVAGHGRTKQAQADLQRAHADVTTLEDAIKVEVTQGYQGLLAADAAWEAACVGLEAARETYRVRREQLRAGVVNITDLLQAETELTRARVDVVDSAVGLRLAKATLLRAIGVQP